jgi:hypothetical protein
MASLQEEDVRSKLSYLTVPCTGSLSHPPSSFPGLMVNVPGVQPVPVPPPVTTLVPITPMPPPSSSSSGHQHVVCGRGDTVHCPLGQDNFVNPRNTYMHQVSIPSVVVNVDY